MKGKQTRHLSYVITISVFMNYAIKSIVKLSNTSINYSIQSNHNLFLFRHRRVDEDSMTLGAKCCFTFLMLITQILLHGVVGLVLYWVWMFHKGDDPSKIIYVFESLFLIFRLF